ncbi:MAG TPA: hypothetical protein VHY09_00320 [Candidatus Methylacidiphilales bacterium]|jgi:hypothetical protein|nr:hypothetical protein [Candidatus Methylacidiphilales bacterium]
MKTNIKTITARIRLAALNLLFLGTTVAFADDAAVGPRPEALPESDYVGTLVVYTATTERPDGGNTTRYPHTPYRIYQDGKLVRQVQNGQDIENETPTTVTLHRGRYTVVAQGRVRVPVLIETGRRTTLHLDDETAWTPDATTAEKKDLVRLPNGQPIGYRAQ